MRLPKAILPRLSVEARTKAERVGWGGIPAPVSGTLMPHSRSFEEQRGWREIAHPLVQSSTSYQTALLREWPMQHWRLLGSSTDRQRSQKR